MAYKKRDRPTGAQAGNSNGTKLKEKDVRQDAYDDYCAHLAEGRGKRGWFYDKDGYSCSYETMEKYIKDEIEFDPSKKLNAEAKGYRCWESVVMDSANGRNKHANTATLQMFMRNKYGWDRADQNQEKSESTALIAVEAFVLQLKQYRLETMISPKAIADDSHNE